MSTKDQVKNLLAPKIKTAVILNKAELFELANNSQKQSKHEFDELKHSIRKNGFDETLLVRPVDGRYEVVSGNHLVVQQPVSVSIEAKKFMGFFTGAVTGGDAYLLWGLGLLNVILIVAIIIVVIRILRK